MAYNNNTMRNPHVKGDVGRGYALVSLVFGTAIPTSFSILMEMFLHLFQWYFTASQSISLWSVWSVCCVSCLSGLRVIVICLVCLGCLSFLPTSYIAIVCYMHMYFHGIVL